MLAWFGWSASPIARIGDDLVGSLVRRELEQASVDWSFVSHTARAGTPTIIQEFVRGPDGYLTHRFRIACPTCRGYLPRFTAPTVAATIDALEKMAVAPRVFFFDRACPAAIHAAEWIREQGGLVVFEPSNLGDPGLFSRAVRNSDIVKYSSDHQAKLADAIDDIGARVEIETHGSGGLRYRIRRGRSVTQWHKLRAYRTPRFSDAAGAGDSCTVGLIHALAIMASKENDWPLSVSSLRNALALGQALASINCSFLGARGMMRVLSATRAIRLANRLVKSRMPPRLPADPIPQDSSPSNDWTMCISCTNG